MLAVSVAAATTGLTTVARVKAALSIGDTSEDTFLTEEIVRVSALICDYLGVVAADDGTRPLGRETLVETFRLPRCRPEIILSRAPVTSITSVVEDGETLTASDYEIDKAPGLLRRLSDDERIEWPAVKIVVTYVAGWLLPGDASANMPAGIEAAAIELIKARRAARTRDPLVKSREVPGVLRTDYWVGAVGDGGVITTDLASMLDPYRNLARGDR